MAKVRVKREKAGATGGVQTALVDESKLDAARSHRWEPISDEEYRSIQRMREANPAVAGAESFIRGATFGLYDPAAVALGRDPRDIAAGKELIGPVGEGLELVGAVAPALATGGAGAVGTAARVAPAGAAARLGGVVSRGTSKTLGGGLAARAAGTAAAGSVEAGLYSAGQLVSESALGGPEVPERLLAHVGTSMALGAALGLGGRLVFEGAGAAAAKAGPRLEAFATEAATAGARGGTSYEAAGALAGFALGDVTGAVGGAVAGRLGRGLARIAGRRLGRAAVGDVPGAASPEAIAALRARGSRLGVEAEGLGRRLGEIPDEVASIEARAAGRAAELGPEIPLYAQKAERAEIQSARFAERAAELRGTVAQMGKAEADMLKMPAADELEKQARRLMAEVVPPTQRSIVPPRRAAFDAETADMVQKLAAELEAGTGAAPAGRVTADGLKIIEKTPTRAEVLAKGRSALDDMQPEQAELFSTSKLAEAEDLLQRAAKMREGVGDTAQQFAARRHDAELRARLAEVQSEIQTMMSGKYRTAATVGVPKRIEGLAATAADRTRKLHESISGLEARRAEKLAQMRKVVADADAMQAQIDATVKRQIFVQKAVRKVGAAAVGAGRVAAKTARAAAPFAVTKAVKHGDRAREILAVRDRVNGMASDPLKLAEVARDDALFELAPEAARARIVGLSRAAAYLKSVEPPTYRPPFGGGVELVDPFALAQYERSLQAVIDPYRTVLRGLVDGTLGPDQVEAVHAVYPKILEAIRESTLRQLGAAEQRGHRIPSSALTRLGILLDMPLDASLAADNYAQIQAALSMPSPQPAGPAPGGRPTKAPVPEGKGDALKTSSEMREDRRNR